MFINTTVFGESSVLGGRYWTSECVTLQRLLGRMCDHEGPRVSGTFHIVLKILAFQPQRSRTWCPRCPRFSPRTPCSGWPVGPHVADLSPRSGGREEVSGCPRRAGCTRTAWTWFSVPRRRETLASTPAWPRTGRDAGPRRSPSPWPVSHTQAALVGHLGIESSSPITN